MKPASKTLQLIGEADYYQGDLSYMQDAEQSTLVH